MKNAAVNIWAKELLDTIRDRKSMIHGLLVPLAVGIVYAVVNPLLTSFIEAKAEKPIEVPVQGLGNADPSFQRALSALGVTLVERDGDLAAAVAAGEESAGLIIPQDFSRAVEQEKEATLVLLTNRTAGGMFKGGFSVKRLELALALYGKAVSLRRLTLRDVDPSVLAPVTLDARDLSTPGQRAGLFAAIMLPLLVAIVAAQGGMFIAIDVTAGEKERGTLEALLVTPARDFEIFAGKLAAVFTMTAVPVVLTMAGFWTAGALLPESVTKGAVLPPSVAVYTALLTLPLALFLNVMLMIISIRTRTFKDAQSSLTPFILAVVLASNVAAFAPPENPLLFLVPVYGTSAAVGSLSLAGPVPPLAVPLSVAGNLAASIIGTAVALRMFNREKLLFGS